MARKVNVIQTTIQEINDFLYAEIPNLKRSISTEMLKVIVWVSRCNETIKTLLLGFALEQDVGYKPFCGSAANQILRLLIQELKKKFPELQQFNIYSVAILPPQEIKEKWML